MNYYWILVILDQIKTHLGSRLDLNTLLAGSVIDNQTRGDCAALYTQDGARDSTRPWKGV